MELLGKISIFHNIFKSIENVEIIFWKIFEILSFFIENDAMF